MENKCKKCGEPLTRVNEMYCEQKGYCEKCFIEKEKIKVSVVITLIIIVIIIACTSGGGTSKKSNSRYDYKTKSDGTRTWYEKDNPHIVDLDKYK